MYDLQFDVYAHAKIIIFIFLCNIFSVFINEIRVQMDTFDKTVTLDILYSN